jgi:GAF domain-containing protein
VLQRASRALKALTKCGESLVHSTDETALLQDICQIIVEVGGYRMAWIGYAEMDEKKTVRPMAYRGYEDGYVGSINAFWSDADRGRGPTGTAIKTGRQCIVRYVRDDSKFIPWRDEALKRGYASVIGLPLRSNDITPGALTIYSRRRMRLIPRRLRCCRSWRITSPMASAALRTGYNIAENARGRKRPGGTLPVTLWATA